MRIGKPLIIGIALLVAAQALAWVTAPRRSAAGLGSLPPGEFAGTLMLGGFRGLACDLLWLRAVAAKDDKRTYESVALAEAITRVQPRFVDVWMFLAHDLAYNIGFDADGEDGRFAWYSAGVNANARGIERNPGVERLVRHLAWVVNHKGDLFHARIEATDWAPLLNPLLADIRARVGDDPRAADLPTGGKVTNFTIAHRLYTASIALGEADLRAGKQRQPAFVRRMAVHTLDADGNLLRNRGEHLAAIRRWLDAGEAWMQVAAWAQEKPLNTDDANARRSTLEVFDRHEGRIRRKANDLVPLLAPDPATATACATAIEGRRWDEARRLLSLPGWKTTSVSDSRIRWLDEEGPPAR